jgi:hypothetical protein
VRYLSDEIVSIEYDEKWAGSGYADWSAEFVIQVRAPDLGLKMDDQVYEDIAHRVWKTVCAALENGWIQVSEPFVQEVEDPSRSTTTLTVSMRLRRPEL